MQELPHSQSPEEYLESGEEEHRTLALLMVAAELRYSNPQRAFALADEAEQRARAEHEHGHHSRALFIKGGVQADFGQHAEALSHYHQALKLARLARNPAMQGSILNGIGIVHFEQGEYPQAITTWEQSLGIKEELGDRESQATTLQNLGMIYNILGQHEQALEHYNKSLSINIEFGNQRGTSRAYHNIATYYLETHQIDVAIEFLNRSLHIKEQIGDRQGMATTYNNLGNASFHAKDYDGALQYYQKSLALKQSLGDTMGVASTQSSMGKVYEKQGNAEAAKEMFHHYLSIARQVGRPLQVAIALEAMGAFHARQDDAAAAIAYLTQAAEAARGLDAKTYLHEILQNLTSILIQTNHHQDAAAILMEVVGLQKEIFNAETDRRIKKMQALYQVEQARKESEILQLNNKHLAQEAEFRNKELATTAMYLTQKNEMLRKLRRHVADLREFVSPKGGALLRQVEQELGEAIGSEEHWSGFERQFQQVHAGYLEALAARYPGLTPTELKVCSLIKINLSTKEIAQILNTESRSIEKYRQRIRKKLGLGKDDNLSTFLAAIGAAEEQP